MWDEDPATFHGDHYDFGAIRVLPPPAHRIPIWIGGSGERAHRRAVDHGDGFHFIGVTPEERRRGSPASARNGPNRSS